MIDDDQIGERIRQAADRAAADIPTKHPGPDFFARVGQPEPQPFARRYVAYGFAAAAAVVAIVFGVVVLQNPETPEIDTVSPPPTQPTATVTTIPEAVDLLAVQLAADAETAAGFGLTIGEPLFEPDGSISPENQPDLVAFTDGDVVVGYTKPAEVFDDTAPSFGVYAPDGVTLRGRVDRSGRFLSVEPAD